MEKESIKVGIVGGTGYTGVELLRILAQHPRCELAAITSRKEAGMPVADMFPNLRGRVDAAIHRTLATQRWQACDVVFFATPNGVAMEQARALYDAGVRMIDIAADFRLKDVGAVGAVVRDEARLPRARGRSRLRPAGGEPRAHPQGAHRRQSRAAIRPRCSLGFLPLVESGVVDLDHLIADAKSGVCGAGRKAEVHTLFAEASRQLQGLRRRGPSPPAGDHAGARRDGGRPVKSVSSSCRI